jgi:hypothetical protein
VWVPGSTATQVGPWPTGTVAVTLEAPPDGAAVGELASGPGPADGPPHPDRNTANTTAPMSAGTPVRTGIGASRWRFQVGRVPPLAVMCALMSIFLFFRSVPGAWPSVASSSSSHKSGGGVLS